MLPTEILFEIFFRLIDAAIYLHLFIKESANYKLTCRQFLDIVNSTYLKSYLEKKYSCYSIKGLDDSELKLSRTFHLCENKLKHFHNSIPITHYLHGELTSYCSDTSQKMTIYGCMDINYIHEYLSELTGKSVTRIYVTHHCDAFKCKKVYKYPDNTSIFNKHVSIIL